MYTYNIRIDEKLKRPVVIYITDNNRTVHIIRGSDIDSAEAEAAEWISERTPKGI